MEANKLSFSLTNSVKTMTNVHGFKYGNGAQAVVDLVNGMHESVVSDGQHTKPLSDGNLVVAVAAHEGKVYATVGLATSEYDARSSEDIWPNWELGRTVHKIDWFKKVVSIDRSEFDLGYQKLPLETARAIATKVLA